MRGWILTILLVAYCILMPFEEALAFAFGSILKIFGIIIIVFCVLNCNNKRLSSSIVPLIIWLLFMLLSYVWCSSEIYWKSFIVIYVGQVALLVSLELIDIHDFNFKWIDIGLVLTGCVASYVLIKFPATSMFTDEGRRTIMINGATLDPNIVAATIILGLHIATNQVLTNLYKMQKLLYGGLSLFMLYGILLTGSRGALIAFVVSFAFKILLETKNNPNARKKIVYLIPLAIIGFCALLAILPPDLIESRFSKDTILGLNEREQGSHNRYDIWLAAAELFVKSPVWGWGCGNFINSIRLVYDRQCAAHNLYVLQLVEGGIIGFSLLFKYIYSIWKNLMRHKDYLTISLLTATLLMSLSLDAIPYKFFWITLIYCRLQIRREDACLNR